MKSTILISVVALALLADGYVHGIWTNRWGSASLDGGVARIQQIPLTIGDWQARTLELSPNQAERSGFAGCWLRSYERRRDGMAVTVLLACGLPGPLAVHTPEVCYAGSGYVQTELPRKYAAGSAKSNPEFWKAKFSKPNALVPVHLRLFWSWRTMDGWKAAQNARLEFASQTMLYKLYVTYEMTGADDQQDDAVCAEFINLLLPELERALAPQP
jgi:hypothetical protein